jgi:SAM-dependent methyltransferase
MSIFDEAPPVSAEDDFTRLRRELGCGPVADATFDALYPAPIESRSAQFWTPVAVAVRAAELFVSHGVRRVLDVGSGAGKFCLTAACVRPDVDFTGIEQRPHLVEAARLLGMQLGLENARFIAGDATSLSWGAFDGLYFYNPFAENLCCESDHLDETVELSHRRYMADIQRVITALASATVGTCLVTYNSFGGPIPASFELAHEERAGTDWLRVWVKRRATAEQATFYVEDRDRVLFLMPRP